MQQLIEKIRTDYDQTQWELTSTIGNLLKHAISSLPKHNNVSTSETRYPESQEGMRAFYEKFFARHFFQIQDSLLETDSLVNLICAIRGKRLNIADIGCGPAIGTLAVLDLVQQLQAKYSVLPKTQTPLTLSVVLNDTSPICLEFGKTMIEALLPRLNYPVEIKTIRYLKEPFPESIRELRRFICQDGMFNLGIMSYVLIPLKEQLTYTKLCAAIDSFIRLFYPLNCSCLIIQDRFRELLIRRVSRLLNSSSEKCQLTQKVYDPDNSNEFQTYTYFRSIISSNRVYKTFNLSESALKSLSRQPAVSQ